MIILDTNVTSELMTPTPEPRVVAWVGAHRAEGLATTAVTLAEIRDGIERLPDGRRKDDLRAAAAETFATFSEQVEAFDVSAAEQYAHVVTTRERLGRPINGFDAQIAAICRARHAAVATWNVPDFVDVGVTVMNPWEPEP